MRANGASRSASETTATVLTPSRRAVRMMRTAISPRLAMRTFLNIGEELIALPRPDRAIALWTGWLNDGEYAPDQVGGHCALLAHVIPASSPARVCSPTAST